MLELQLMRKTVRKHGDQRVKFHFRGSRSPSSSQLLPVDGENGGELIEEIFAYTNVQISSNPFFGITGTTASSAG